MASKDSSPDTEKSETEEAEKSGKQESKTKEPELEPAPRRPAQTIDLKAEEVDEGNGADNGDKKSDDKKPGDKDGADAKSAKDASSKTKAGEQASAKPRRKEPPQRTSRRDVASFVTHLAAGLIGGVIGVVGVGYGLEKLPLAGLLGRAEPQQATEDGALAGRIAALEEKIAAQPEPAPASDESVELLKGLDDRIGRLEQDRNAAQDIPTEVKDRIGRIEDTIKTLGETAAQGGDVAQTAAITTQIEELATRLESRITALEKAPPPATDDSTKSAVAALSDKVAALSTALQEQAKTTPEGGVSEELTSRLSSLEKALATLKAAPPVAREESSAGAALALRLSALIRAAEQGRPYGEELEALKKTAPPDLDLSAFAAHAEKPVPSRAQLASQFRQRSEQAAKAMAPPPDDQSLVGRFLTSAQSVIRVRRIDGASGDSPEAVLSRMAARLEAGDLAGALKASAKLPDETAKALGSWLEQARARVALDAAAEGARDQLAKSLAQESPERSQ